MNGNQEKLAKMAKEFAKKAKGFSRAAEEGDWERAWDTAIYLEAFSQDITTFMQHPDFGDPEA